MRNNYSISETVSNAFALVCTKLFYGQARLIRRPFYCRGKRRMRYGEGFTIGHHCRFDLLGEGEDGKIKLTIGRNCKIGDNVHIVANDSVTIGDNCLMASKIFISDTSHGDYSGGPQCSPPDSVPDGRPLFTKPVRIGHNVWIGENACILLGVSVGDGSIVGANSVVTRDVMPNTIVAGAPARPIKVYDKALRAWVRV